MSDPETSFVKDQTLSGGYRIEEFVGRGGFGEVWKAEDTGLKRWVALKFMTRYPANLRVSASEFVLDEGRKASLLTDTTEPGSGFIVRVNRGYGGDDTVPPYLDLEWMDGGSLADLNRQRHKQGAGFTREEVLRVALQIGRALQCAHRRDVVHCDLKPGNVLLRKSEEDRWLCKLSDFGLAWRINTIQQEVMGMTAWGTYPYLSPERFLSPGEAKPPSDMYSLGVMLFELIEGRRPFDGKNLNYSDYRTLHLQHEPPQMLSVIMPGEFMDLVRACLKKSPDDRPDALAFVREIERIGQGEARWDFADRPPAERLRVLSRTPRIEVEHRDSHVVFCSSLTHGPGIDEWLPLARPVTNRDFYRFVSVDDPKHQRWRPGAVPFTEHDGGYLQHWYFQKPHTDDYDRILTGLTHAAARTFAEWLGGRLATPAELETIFFGPHYTDIAAEFRSRMAQESCDVLQFWCDDDDGGSELKPMWRYLPDASELARALALCRRPRFFALPHFTLMVVIPGRHVKRLLDAGAADTGRATGDDGPASSQGPHASAASAQSL